MNDKNVKERLGPQPAAEQQEGESVGVEGVEGALGEAVAAARMLRREPAQPAFAPRGRQVILAWQAKVAQAG
jgi:hypothetical protein